MALSIPRYSMVTFKNVGGIACATHPWPVKFLATLEFMDRTATLQPITIRVLLWALITNYVTLAWWRIWSVFFKIGFWEPPEGIYVGWGDYRKYWHWKFWKIREARAVVKALHAHVSKGWHADED